MTYVCFFFVMWCQHVVIETYVDKVVNTLLVFDYFYHSNNVTREYLTQQNIKYIGAIHPNRFKLQCDMLHKKVRTVGDCAEIFNKTTGKIIMQHAKAQHGRKEAKIRTAISNAYRRYSRTGTTHHRSVIDACKKSLVCKMYSTARSNVEYIFVHRSALTVGVVGAAAGPDGGL